MDRGFVWMVTFCFISVVCDSAVVLLTKPPVETTCGENVSLICNASFPNQQDVKIMKFHWVHKNKVMCEDKDNDTDRFQCEHANKTSHQKLAMILVKIKPVQEGEYLCKIHTNVGMKDAITNVVVKDCFEKPAISENGTHVTCSFMGTYPRGTVHWFQGSSNLTNETFTQEEKDQDGFYALRSTIDKKKRNGAWPLNCSLLMPNNREYVASAELVSSGSTVTLQWACVVVALIVMSYWM